MDKSNKENDQQCDFYFYFLFELVTYNNEEIVQLSEQKFRKPR